MKLHVFPFSPNARKVLFVVHHLGLDVETPLVDLFKSEQMEPWFLGLNPNHMMPLLQDGDFVLWESNAIMQYLAAQKPGSGLWPSDAKAQADVSRWQCWQLAHWGSACRTLIFENMVKQFLNQGEPDPAEVASAEEKFHRFAAVLTQYVSGRDWLVGDSVTLADVSVGVWLTYQEPAKFPLDQYGEIRRWYANLERLDAWKKSAPPLPSGT